MIRYSVFWRLSRALGRSIVAATVGMVLSAVAAPASAQITVGGNGGDTVDSTTYSGTQGLTKIGTNSVTLTGNNTYTGGTIVNQGMLTLGGGSDSSGSTGVGPYTIGNGSALRVTAAGFWFNGTPTFNFTSSGGGTIDSASGVNFILNGATTFTSAGGAQNQIVGAGGINTHTSPSLTFNVARGTDANVDLLLSTSIWNGGSITKIGTGILAMTGANSYAGSTTISAGTLQIGTGGTTGSLGSGAVVNNTSLVFNRSDNFTVANTMSGSGSLMKNGAGTVTLTGSNTATGGTTINAGMLTLAGGSDSPGSTSVGPYTIGSGATLRVNANQYWFNGTPTFTFTSSGGGTIDSSGTTNFIMANDALYTANGGARSQIVGAAGINLNGKVVTFNVARGTDATADLLVSTGIWNNGSITKTGSGILVLSGSNTYTGGTTINTGTLTLAGGSDSSGLTGVGPYTIGNGAALRVTAAGFWFNGTPTFNFTSSGGGTIDSAANANFILNGASTINSTGGAQNQITGPAGLNTHNGPTLTFNVARGTDANADVLVSAGIWNGGGITKNGNGILALTGANSYAGTTTISGGTLQIGNGGTTGALGSGAVVNNAALVFNRANALTVSAAISGSGTLVQCGLGTTTLSAQTTHTGGTIVEAGTLLLSGSDRLAPASSATVNSGGTLRLDGNQTLASIAGSGAITFGTSITGFTLTTGSVSSTFAGSISGMGYLWKVGPGTLTLTGSHSYIAGTVVAGGTLATVGNNVLPTSGNIAVNAGGTLLLGGNQTVSSAGGSGGVYNLNGYTLTMADAAAAFGGDTAGGGVLAKTGGGTWSIFGTTSGSTAVVLSGGSIKLMGNNRLSDSGAVTINGGTFDMNGFTDLAGSVTVNGGRIINGTLQAVGVSMNNGTVSGVLTGTGGFTKTSAGTVVISSTSSYTGETAIQGGTLETTGANRLSAASTMNVSAGGTFKMGGDQTLASVAGSGAINLGAGTLTTGSSSSTFAGSITGNGGLTKVGPGTLTLSGSNAFTGDTNLNGGTLVLASANALPTDAIVTMQSGATLQLSGTTVVGAIENNGGTISGGTLVASLVATQSGALDSVIADGEVNGTPFAAGILKRSAGTTTIGAANTFTGAIRLQGGTLQLSGSGSFDPASRLVMSSGATMDLNGKSQTFSALSGTGGTVALGSGQLTVNNAAGGVFAGVISGSGGVVKTGAGLLELTGASTYTGPTAIDAGELKLNGSLASSSLALAAGATLSGTGSIGGNATIAGIHMPGNSPGIQSVGGDLTYAAGSSVTWELTDNTAALSDRGVEFDGINVGGNLTFLGTSLLNLAFNGSGSLVNWNDPFWETDKAGVNGWLIYDTAGTTSSLSGLAINGTDWLDGAGNSLLGIRPNASFALQQVGSDVYLTFQAVPEPSTFVLVGIGLAGLALARRRM